MARNLTIKGWLHKANIAKSAEAFLKANRDYLMSGELAPLSVNILDRLDNGEIMPTPALSEIVQAVFNHTLIAEAAKAEEKIAKQGEGGGRGTTKPYTTVVFDSNGPVQDANQDGFMAARDWADRRLFDGAPDYYAVIYMNAGGPDYIVHRADSMLRILRVKSGPVTHTNKVGGSGLSFGVKAKPSRNVRSNMGLHKPLGRIL